MIKYEKILADQGYWLTDIQHQLQEAVRKYLKEQGLTQQQFAERMGVNQSYISQILNGQFDHRISRMIAIYLAIEQVPFISTRPLQEVIEQWQRHTDRNWNYELTYKEAFLSEEPYSEQKDKAVHYETSFTL